MKNYYGVKDVQQITGVSQNKAYEIIRKLQESFYKKYPNSIFIQSKIPIWYFEEAMMNVKPKERS